MRSSPSGLMERLPPLRLDAFFLPGAAVASAAVEEAATLLALPFGRPGFFLDGAGAAEPVRIAASLA